MTIPLLTARVTAVVLAAASAWAAPSAAADNWQSTGPGITSGVSGLAFTGESPSAVTDALAVHDNKHEGERRVSRVLAGAPGGDAPRTEELRWEGARPPVDLEALSEVPGRPGEFAALESSGRGYHLRLLPGAVRVEREFTVPGASADENYEGFALSRQAGRLVAAWAHRGQEADPGVLRLAELDWDRLGFGAVQEAAVRVAVPTGPVRHISDVEITGTGRVLITSATDPGDDGPFASSVHEAGHIRAVPSLPPVLVVLPEPLPLAVHPGHKAEAIACPAAGGRPVLGADDENAGGAVLRDRPLCES
jgi:hypothetical protein